VRRFVLASTLMLMTPDIQTSVGQFSVKPAHGSAIRAHTREGGHVPLAPTPMERLFALRRRLTADARGWTPKSWPEAFNA
jgi:hypothetical protein